MTFSSSSGFPQKKNLNFQKTAMFLFENFQPFDSPKKEEEEYDNSFDGQSEHFGNDGDLSPENDGLGASSDNEEEDDTDDEMEDDDAEIEGVAATAASMKDVFLFPNSTITLSVAGNVLSKSIR